MLQSWRSFEPHTPARILLFTDFGICVWTDRSPRSDPHGYQGPTLISKKDYSSKPVLCFCNQQTFNGTCNCLHTTTNEKNGFRKHMCLPLFFSPTQLCSISSFLIRNYIMKWSHRPHIHKCPLKRLHFLAEILKHKAPL